MGRLASLLVSAAQYAIMGGAAFGDSLVASASLPPALQQALDSLKQNKMAAIGGAWFFGTSLSQSFLKTGAFEVSLDGELVWSGIEHGRPPNGPGEVLRALRGAGLAL